MQTQNSEKNISFPSSKKPITILGFPLYLILIILAISIAYLGFSFSVEKVDTVDKGVIKWHNLIGVLLIAMVVAELFKVIGKKTPILKDIGGGAILSLLVPAFIFNYNCTFLNDKFRFNLFQQAFRDNIKTFNGAIGFSEMFVASLVVGSLLGIDKEMLKRNGLKFLSLVVISLIVSATFVGIAGWFLNPIGGIDGLGGSGQDKNGALNALFYIFVPIASGGLTCGIIPLSTIFSQRKGKEIVGGDNGTTVQALFTAHIITALLIGGIVSVMFSGLIKKIFGKSKFSSPTGSLEKELLPSVVPNAEANTAEVKKEENKITFEQIKTGFVAIFALYAVSALTRSLLACLIPSAKNLIPPTIIFLVVLVLVFKVFDIISDRFVKSIEQASKLVTNNLSSAILVVIGVTIDINAVIKNVSNINFFIVSVLTVLTTALTSAIVGNKMGYYPVQASIAGGLCANSIGGVGNLAILEASDSFELMPYAQISTRIGGDLVVIIASIFYPVFYTISIL
ncbi:MAG: malate/citrate symporter [Candidatus Phytoplasma pruni]|uniref:2-hydroxycarboxylate transporter family protein n=1 Tax=Poinsettia branch-inducing phytoplasma TaxID=138647 RepID=UPI0003639546|nr:2-hydroxycarboxylate transporter family protein [Poinsettia branch-inducing phytoplasma]WEK82249.1 MAG: malate/citrate symporter [Candidatus Phytoplasma pruni]